MIYVPGLKRNVITLDSKKCSLVTKRGLIKVKRDYCIMLLGKKFGNLYILLESKDFKDVTKNKRVWNSVGKSIEGIDDEAAITSVITISTQGEDDHNSKVELLCFVFDDVGDLKFIGDVNLSNGVTE